MWHLIEHALGLCGEKHPSIIAMIMEHQSIANVINYLKSLYGRL